MPDDFNPTQKSTRPAAAGEAPICPYCGADPLSVRPVLFRCEPLLNCVCMICNTCRKALTTQVLGMEQPVIQQGNLQIPNGKPMRRG